MRKARWIAIAVLGCSLACFAACQRGASPAAAQGGVTEKRLADADSEPGQWLSVGRTHDEQRYSPLTQITPDNVG
ncbi:MAG: hypothetical protein LBE59_10575, partial [Nevskiaceae bacterium]|nr:hypothetical protein [Nevskiaceae bacterium]